MGKYFFKVDANTDATMQLTHQYDQRMSKRRVLFFKLHLRLKWQARKKQ